MGFSVHIAVDDNRNFTYTPAVLRMSAMDSVNWTCDDPFVVHFVRRSPFPNVEFRAVEGGRTPQVGARSGLVPGAYHYVVAVFHNGEVCVDAGCPEIIFDAA